MSIFQPLKQDNTFFYFATSKGTSEEETLDLAKNYEVILRPAYKKTKKNLKPPPVSTGARDLNKGFKIILCYGGGRGGKYRPIAELTVIEDHKLLNKINDLPVFGVVKDPDLIQKVTGYGGKKDPYLREFTAIGVEFKKELLANPLIKKPNSINAIICFNDVRDENLN